MAYVEHLLRGKLDEHRASLGYYKELGQHEDVASCLAVISELEYVLKLLNNDKTYRKY